MSSYGRKSTDIKRSVFKIRHQDLWKVVVDRLADLAIVVLVLFIFIFYILSKLPYVWHK